VKTKRRQARILVVQALFQLDAQGDDFLEQVAGFLGDSGQGPDVVDDADRLTRGAWAGRDRADALIGGASEHWAVDRMGAADRSILRLAVSEMMAPDGPPAAVVIDEAIELGKRFGGAESPQFINGVLDAVRKRLEASAGSADD